jgi:hypothetical protein
LKAEKPVAPEAGGIRGPQTLKLKETRRSASPKKPQRRASICEKSVLQASGRGARTGLEASGFSQAIEIEGDKPTHKYECKTRTFSESFVL